MDKISQSTKHIISLTEYLDNWLEVARLFGVDKEKLSAADELMKKLKA